MITNFMVFSDPDGSVLFKFQRITNTANVLNMTGDWMINSLNSVPTSHMIEINNKSIVFCQRFAQVNYSNTITNRI